MNRYCAITAILLFVTQASSFVYCQTETGSADGEGGSGQVRTQTLALTDTAPSFADYSADPIELVGNPSVQKDLELLDSQVEQIYVMHAAWAEETQTSMNDLRSGKISGEEYTQNLITAKAAREKILDSLLLPHQAKRLAQITTQAEIGNKGTAEAITGMNLSERLGISEGQRNELLERSKKIEKRLADEIARLKREAKKELLAVLTSEQRTKLHEMTGTPIETRNSDWNEALRKHRKRTR